MGWREDFSRITGPGLILGITLGDLARLLWQNDLRVPPRYWPKVAFAGLISLLSTPLRRIENVVCGRRVAEQPVTAPLFIIGHWRSGTTHLHNLISIDPRFAFASFSQITIPHTFLFGERLLSTGSALFLASVALFAFPHELHRPLISLGMLPASALLVSAAATARVLAEPAAGKAVALDPPFLRAA